MVADLVLFNGTVYTLASGQPRAQALAVRDGRIVYVGDDAPARQLLRPGGQAVDLHGCCAIPGLVDAHIHFQAFASGLQAVDAETPTLDEALARVAQHAACTAAGRWVTGHGWNHNVWGGQFPTAAQLDRVAPDRPVALAAKSGHALWVNSRALELAGIRAETPDPPGGQVVRDTHGQATGILLENAMDLVSTLLPEPSLDEAVEALRQAQPIAHRAGLTGVHDFDGPLAFRAYQVLHQRGELALRVTKSIRVDELDQALALGLRTGLGDDWLRIGHVKLFADGALGPRTALMLEGYDSAPGETGIATMDLEDIHQAVEKASRAGLACAVHAIGDRANRQILDVYQRAMRHNVDRALRHRIEHVQLLHPDDYPRLAALGVIASMQPLHATSDMLMAEQHWGKRCQVAYALRSLADSGAVLALGSDCPVEPIYPLLGIHAAVTRRRADGSPGPDGWFPGQRLSVEQAVRGFSWGPAYAAGLEGKLGSLEPGKLADVTILDQDIMAIEPMDILAVRVVGTLVGGQFAWRDAALA